MKRIAIVTSLILLVSILVWGFGCTQTAIAPSPTAKPTAPVAPTTAPAPKPTAAPAPAPAPAPVAKGTVLKAISYKAPGSFVIDSYQEWVKLVTERSKGELVIEYRGSIEVVPQNDQPEAIRKGVIDVLIMPGSRFAGLFPEALSLPVTSLKPAEERSSGYYAFMDEKFKTVNIKYIGRVTANWYYLFTNKKVEKPAELKGQKLRSTSTYNPFVKALGATPASIDNAEVYSALEKKVIDGFVTTVEEPIELSTWEVTKYIVDHFFYEGYNPVTVMNLDVWNKLPKNLQDLVISATVDFEGQKYPASEKIAVDSRAELIKKGMTPIKFSAEDGKAFRELAYSSYYDDMKTRMSAESFNKIMGFLKK